MAADQRASDVVMRLRAPVAEAAELVSADRVRWDDRHRVCQTWLDPRMQLLDHPDRHTEPLDRSDHLPIDRAIAIRLGWGDKKIRNLLVFRPHKPRVCDFLERQPLPA